MAIADMPGWRDSFGIGEEIKWCREHNKSIYVLSLVDMTLAPL